MIVYLLHNRLTGKSYVGQTVRLLSERLKLHRGAARRGVKTAIAAAIRKYGWSAFEVCLLDVCETQDELNGAEIHWIKRLNCLAPDGYNLRTGGAEGYKLTDSFRRSLVGPRGWTHTDEHKQHMARLMTGRPKDRDHANKVRDAIRANNVNMTLERAREIRLWRAEYGATYRQTAIHFGISLGQAGHILANETWRESV